MGDLHLLAAIMEANKELLPEMEPFRLKLLGVVTQSQDVTAQQAALKAAKQEGLQAASAAAHRGGRRWPMCAARR